MTTDMRLISGLPIFEPRPTSDRQGPKTAVSFDELHSRVVSLLFQPPTHPVSPDALDLCEAYFRHLETIRLVTTNRTRLEYWASERFLALLAAMERGRHWKD